VQSRTLPPRDWSLPISSIALAFIYWFLFWAIPAAAHLYFRIRPPGWSELGAGLAVTAGWVAATAALNRFRTVFCVCGYVILGLGTLLEIGALSTTRSDFYSGFVEVILQTNLRETREFFMAGVSPAFPLFAAMLVLPYLVLRQLRGATTIGRRPGLVIAGGLAALLLPLIGARILRTRNPYSSYDHLQILRALRTGIGQAVDERRLPPSRIEGVVAKGVQPDLLVVIVGESLARRHMGLYGYRRDTTPNLSALARDGRIFAFDDVVSSRGYTSASLRDAFSLPRESQTKGRRATLFQALNAAGYDTWWLSNQSPFGAAGDPLVGLTKAVTHKQWHDMQITPDRRIWDQRAPWDENILPAFEQSLSVSGGKRAIFLHLMGCHVVYRNRYPAGFEPFHGVLRSMPPSWAKTINEYDTCVRYNDFVVTEVLRRLSRAGSASALVYFSDHGEEVYDYRDRDGHDDAAPSKYMAEVPFVVWLSEDFRTRRPELAQKMPTWLDRPFSLGDLSAALADLAGIRFPGYQAERSIFAAEFQPHTRSVGEHFYDILPDGPR
jgi:heptose-I-phosphate ethanolaminephosphotransferase